MGEKKNKSGEPDSCEMHYIYIYIYIYTHIFLCCLFFVSGHRKRWAIGTHLHNIISPCRDAWLYYSEAKSQQHFSETLLNSSEAKGSKISSTKTI